MMQYVNNMMKEEFNISVSIAHVTGVHHAYIHRLFSASAAICCINNEYSFRGC